MALGTDQPLVPVGLSLHLGLRALHLGGFSPAAALRTATVRRPGCSGSTRTSARSSAASSPTSPWSTATRSRTSTPWCARAAVLRGGVPYTTADLVAAFEPHERHAAARGEDWLEVGRLMRRDGCCDAGL